MKDQRVKLLLLIGLLAALGAVMAAFAAGSHLQVGYNDGAFNSDLKVATADSGAATVLGLIALAAGLAGIGLHLSRGGPEGSEAASVPAVAGRSGFSDFAGALRRLTRSRTDVWLGGVCGGLGEYSPLPSWVWRFLFLLLLCFYGTGVLLYVLLWVCLPEALGEERRPSTQRGIVGTAE